MKLSTPATFQELTLPAATRLAGAAALVYELGLSVPVRRLACVSHRHVSGSRRSDGPWIVFDTRYWPGDQVTDHLTFMLKHEDADFLALRRIFEAMPQTVIEAHVRAAPTARHTRRMWFLYETLSGRILDIADAPGVAAIDLLDSKLYFTGKPRLSKRHRVRDNLLGTGSFCPVIKRTPSLEMFLSLDLAARARAGRRQRRRPPCRPRRQLHAPGRQPRELSDRRRAPAAQPSRALGPRRAAGRKEQAHPR